MARCETVEARRRVRGMGCSPGPRREVAAGVMVVLVIAACSAGSHGEERRCTELGEQCLCSEPLDNDDRYAKYHDPSDSTTRECGALDATRGGEGTADLPVAFPEGASASHAFYIESDRGSNGKLTYTFPADPFDLTGKTLCARHYTLFGKDHAPPGNIKIARIGHPDGAAFQSLWEGRDDENASPKVNVIADPGGVGSRIDCSLPVSGPRDQMLVFADCRDHWCRLEICMEHDARSGEHMFRARWTQVGGDRVHELRGNCGARPTPTSRILGGQAAILEYTTTGPPYTEGGPRYLSHAMLAIVPHDPDFWIGPASEIEPSSPPPKP